jgi:hypothetical protein
LDRPSSTLGASVARRATLAEEGFVDVLDKIGHVDEAMIVNAGNGAF